MIDWSELVDPLLQGNATILLIFVESADEGVHLYRVRMRPLH